MDIGSNGDQNQDPPSGIGSQTGPNKKLRPSPPSDDESSISGDDVLGSENSVAQPQDPALLLPDDSGEDNLPTRDLPLKEDSEEESDDEEEEDDGEFTMDIDQDDLQVEPTVYTEQGILRKMDSLVAEVQDTLQLPASDVRILLNHFGWSRDHLMAVYFDVHHGVPEKLFGVIGVAVPDCEKTVSAKPPGTEIDCEICCSSFLAQEMQSISCGHQYCRPCWTAYLTDKIMVDGIGQTIECPAHSCKILVHFDMITKLVADATKDQYFHLIANEFVQKNPLFRWCPKAGCSKAVRLTSHQTSAFYQSGSCDCGAIFCFECENGDHNPIKCAMLKKWIKKCADDSETSNWIVANTKECPKCRTAIEKNGGCNHITCRSSSCKHHFCWVCLGDWSAHGNDAYNCNRFSDDTRNLEHAKSKSQSSLDRYLFYFHRYQSHQDNRKFEEKLHELADNKIQQMQEGVGRLSYVDVQCVSKAVNILCQCRRILTYTYVFAFYLKKNNQAIIFENNQKDLETATENLSEYLEREMDLHTPIEVKNTIEHKSSYCAKRMEKLIEHVADGHQETEVGKMWEYN